MGESAVTPVGVGIVGCGAIHGAYVGYLSGRDDVRLVAFSDLDADRAKRAAEQIDGAAALDMAELIRSPEVEVVLNLTRPQEHVAVGVAALEAGRGVYAEKPLAVDAAAARPLLDAAAATGGRLASAPDSFLSPYFQACRRALDDGAIGIPVAVTAEMLCPGHESWHPDPAFYYRRGGGPLMDMGPYYLTALVALLGPVRSVTARAATTWPTRTVTSAPRSGEIVEVEVPTHVSAVLDFANGTLGTLTTSFDVDTRRAALEIHGTEGTMRCPDPNTYWGPAAVRRGVEDWTDLPLPDLGEDISRGFGVVDLARATRQGRPHRASGELAFHVLDVMTSILASARDGGAVDVASSCERPAPLPVRPG